MPRRVGLYLGVNSIGAVLLDGKKVISLTTLDSSAIEEEAKIESISEEVRLEALIGKALTEISAKTDEIFVSLSDKDFIFRYLELPMMSKKEVENSLIYEIPKYIPFKLEEILWDYQTIFQKKTISVFFVGIKEAQLSKIQNILLRQGFRTITFESASISLARLIKSNKKFSTIKNFAILDFTESEGYITFFYQDLPLFNRYLSISKKSGNVDLDKFSDSVRFSLQYFRREFSFYQLECIIVISSIASDELLTLLREDLGVKVEALLPLDFINNPSATIENIKAKSVVLRDSLPYRFNPKLTKRLPEKITPAEKKVSVGINKPLVIGLTLFGFVVLLFLFFYFHQEISIKNFELSKKEEQISVPSEWRNLNWVERKDEFEKLKSKIERLKKEFSKHKKLSSFFEKLSTDLPEGFWLESLDVTYENEKYKATMRGYVFLLDANKESEEIDNFISSLKADVSLRQLFNSIFLVSTERKVINKFNVTFFVIRLD